ncbi:esterase-like activity of phytase family protein [Mangrovimonas sp. DI 80]|uniref:esterase-like activity of phytase family protein n=1 Tax=Mangrovimonas sp. DI 80 TaxID=1779330 RepID=UPI000977E466|nr:esterase-like activity of phytase family protein [Mangrovimonas sp. DI 80]OMP30061.1 hypothetical protein BKM32_14380 [Mangrovimonas sp. DI 80]
MIRILLNTIVLCSCFIFNGQNVNHLLLEKTFNAPYEISSACTYNNQIIIASEKCGKIFTIDPNTGRTVATETIPFLIDKDKKGKSNAIEGISIYKNYYFLVEEKESNQIIVLDRDTKKKLEIKYTHKFGFPPNIGNKNGLEGIEIDISSNMIYVICEGKKQNHSDLYRIKIEKIEDNTVYLNPLKPIKLKKASYLRYCALALDDKGDLLLLRSTEGSYFIDKITKKELTQNLKLEITATEVIKLSKYVNDKTGNLETNLEGLSYLNGYAIIVSDNKQTDNCEVSNNGKTGKGTMFMRIELGSIPK